MVQFKLENLSDPDRLPVETLHKGAQEVLHNAPEIEVELQNSPVERALESSVQRRPVRCAKQKSASGRPVGAAKPPFHPPLVRVLPLLVDNPER